MSDQPGLIPEYRGVDATTFRNEIVPRYRPAVLRGLIEQWPAVQHARISLQSIGRYLSEFDNGAAGDLIIMPPQVHGRLFYSVDIAGVKIWKDVVQGKSVECG